MITRKLFVIFSITTVIAILHLARYWPDFCGLFLIILPLVILRIYDMWQRNHTILRLYRVIGHLRYLFESVRLEIQQYFVESDTNGQPVNWEFRELVYQRARGVRDIRPLGRVLARLDG